MNQRSKEILHFLIDKNHSSLQELSEMHDARNTICH